MKQKSSTIFFWVALGALLLIGVYFFWLRGKTPASLDAFTTCLQDRGTIFYGAFWCPHCQNQKAFFGRSKKLLPYVECSTPDGQEQLSLCKEKKIEGYPTWEFSDGSRLTGEITLDRLSEKTGCALPHNEQ